MPLSALLFDLDGTLADSDPLHCEAFHTAARRRGVDFDEAFFASHMSGHSNHEIGDSLFPHLSRAEREQAVQEKEQLFRANLTKLSPVAGLYPLLAWARGKGLALGVVSNAPQANIDGVLAAFKIAADFTVTVSAETLGRSKPDPLPYVTALERLGLTAEQAVVFEDAVPGLTAAVRAGIPSVGVLTSHTADSLLAVGAVLTVQDFADPHLLPWLEARL